MRREFVIADCLEWSRLQADRSVKLTLTSSPYEDARTYGIGFKLRGMKWVDWMIPRIVEFCRITDGLVFLNAAGKVRQFKYSPIMEWLVADLTRNCGIVCGPAPYVFHRVGIAGSGNKHYHRRDWEPVYGFAMPDRLPPKFSENTAFGHKPKWAPGGQMSNRNADGQRKNESAGPKAHARWKKSAGSNQWGHSINSGATVTEAGGVVRSRGKRPSHVNADKLHTKTMQDGSRVTQGYSVPAIANPGNVIRCKVGGGQMGHDLAHENEAPFPVQLAERFICWFCGPGETVFDPFCGSGTVGHAAAKHGRGFVLCDVRGGKGGIDTARRRLSSVTPGLFT